MGSMQLRIFTEPQQGADYGRLLAVARAAEELGFDAFFRSDHYLKIGPGSGLPGPTDSWVTLAGRARETGRIRLGTLVSAATFRYPGPLAIAVAQVDEMSAGRIELGLGTGWFDAEHSAYGIPFPGLAERFGRLEEQLEIVTGLWETPVGKTYSFGGSYYTLTESPALPKPVQRPRPPILIGGPGPRRPPRPAAGVGDGYHPAAGGEVRRRVQRRVRQPGGDRCRVRPGPGCLRGGRPRPGVTGVLGGPDGVLRPDRRGGGAAGGRDRPGPGRAGGDRAGRVARAGRGQAGPVRGHRRLPDVPAGPRPARPRSPGADRRRGHAARPLNRGRFLSFLRGNRQDPWRIGWDPRLGA